MKTGAFFKQLFLLMSMSLCSLPSLQGQSVPGAIKYQAVLRDVNGKPLANKSDVTLVVTLRLDDTSARGIIVYREEHKNVRTNAYGVIHLEIGRGNALVPGATLNKVPWAGHKVYLQMEIETDGTGKTYMGWVELVTVPYAFYAEGVNSESLYLNLDDNVLPKYNKTNKTLVNSGVSQKGRVLAMDADTIKFFNSGDASNIAYKFPTTAGSRGQVLRLIDNKGTLAWRDAGDGGGGSIELIGDGQLVFWNQTEETLDVAPIVYDYKGAKGFQLTGDVSGNNNLLTANAMGDAQIWIGDNNSPRLTPKNMSGNMLMDKDGKTTLNMATKGGLSIIPGTNGDKDTLSVAVQSIDTLWKRNASGDLYDYNKGRDLGSTKVGIGTADPTDMLHVQGGNVRFAAAANAAGNTPLFHWDAAKSSLFAGALSSGTTPTIGSYSFALGLDATARDSSLAFGNEAMAAASYSIVIGSGATANNDAAHSVAIGPNSEVTINKAIAIGREAKVHGTRSVVVGDDVIANGESAVVIGHTQYAGKNAVMIGYRNGDKLVPIGDAIVIGSDNKTVETGAIVLGSGNKAGTGSIFVGDDMDLATSSEMLMVGSVGNTKTYDNGLVLGNITANTNKIYAGVISVGTGNQYKNIMDDASIKTNMFGYGVKRLKTDNGYGNVTMIGNSFSDQNAYTFFSKYAEVLASAKPTQKEFLEQPLFVFGDNRIMVKRGDARDNLTDDHSLPYQTTGIGDGVATPFVISDWGNAYFAYNATVVGNLTVKGKVNGTIITSSDARLKDDIKSMFWKPSVLDSLQAVSFTYKSDDAKRIRFGFIAQEVRKVFPNLVSEDNEGMLSMDYIGLVPVLWEINRQLSSKVNKLESELNDIKARLEKLERK